MGDQLRTAEIEKGGSRRRNDRGTNVNSWGECGMESSKSFGMLVTLARGECQKRRDCQKSPELGRARQNVKEVLKREGQ